MRILLVEDNKPQLLTLKQLLAPTDYSIDTATTIKRAKQLFNKYTYVVISLDVILPDGNSLDIIKEIRNSKHNSMTPILVLTSQLDAQTRISTFKETADDYLPKPYLPQEYLLRIKRLSQYRRSVHSNIIELNSYSKLDINKKQLRVNGILIKLTDNEVILLKALYESEFCDISRLQESLGDEFSEDGLRMMVSRLRKKLKDQSGHSLIKTERGKGYYLNL